jgi:hypothetical protein
MSVCPSRHSKSRQEACFQDQGRSARLYQRLCNLKMPFLASDREERASVLGCLSQKSHPTCIHQHLCKIKMFSSAGQEQAAVTLRCFAKYKLGLSVLNQCSSKLCIAMVCCLVQGLQPFTIVNARTVLAEDKLFHFSCVLIRRCS